MGDRRAGRRRSGTALASKTCRSCGRDFEWRRKWANTWDEVSYCSSACRRRGVRAADDELAATILELLARRSAGDTICPSEVARRVARQRGGADEWRALMPPTRAAARRLVAAGQVEIVQRGTVVDPSTARGPIRIRWSG